jgi:hypothetical protein
MHHRCWHRHDLAHETTRMRFRESVRIASDDAAAIQSHSSYFHWDADEYMKANRISQIRGPSDVLIPLRGADTKIGSDSRYRRHLVVRK